MKKSVRYCLIVELCFVLIVGFSLSLCGCSFVSGFIEAKKAQQDEYAEDKKELGDALMQIKDGKVDAEAFEVLRRWWVIEPGLEGDKKVRDKILGYKIIFEVEKFSETHDNPDEIEKYKQELQLKRESLVEFVK